jgi:hypothetical protein
MGSTIGPLTTDHIILRLDTARTLGPNVARTELNQVTTRLLPSDSYRPAWAGKVQTV